MSTQTETQTTDQAAAMADGLRKLADLIETNPAFAPVMRYPLGSMNAPANYVGDTRKLMADFARAALAAGGTVEKDYDGDKWAGINASFGPVCVQVYADRAKVCERVVVGTREVTKEVPDPDALAAVPTVTVTETVEDVRWECTPLLAAAVDDQKAAAA
jgi:hypothetical protein